MRFYRGLERLFYFDKEDTECPVTVTIPIIKNRAVKQEEGTARYV